MKFQCPKCSTRYSIAPEKVPANKTLRFPCKKCDNVIRLRRKATPEEKSVESDQVATRVADINEIKKLQDKAGKTKLPNTSNANQEATKVASISDITAALSGTGAAAKADKPRTSRKPQKMDLSQEATKVASVAEITNALSGAAATKKSAPPAKSPPPLTKEPTAKKPLPKVKKEEWFVLISGKEQGPLSYNKIIQMLERKEIDKRTYVWCESMENWQRLGKVKQFQATADSTGMAAWRVVAPVKDETQAMDANLLREQLQKAKEQKENDAAAEKETNVEFMEAVPLTDSHEISEITEAMDIKKLSKEKSDPNYANAESHVGFEPFADSPDPMEETATDPEPSEPPDDFSMDEIAAATSLPDDIDDYSPTAMTDIMATPQLGDINMLGSLTGEQYLDSAPGPETKIFMASSGIYSRRRKNKIGALVGITLSALLTTIIVLDIFAVFELPGMGFVYEKTGLEDPNKERAITRVESKLDDKTIDPMKRAELESMRRKLLGNLDATDSTKTGSPKNQKPSRRKVEGVKDTKNLNAKQRSMVEDIFSDDRKRETKIKLAESTSFSAPNLPDGLTAEAISKVVTKNSSSMNLCLTEAIRKGEKLTGKMEIEMTIGPRGRVHQVNIGPSKFRNGIMASCTAKRIKSWRFPRFNGDPVTVSYPYILHAGF